ncbi:mixed-linked glucanase precursor [Phyllosticta citriasiana]
MVRVTISSLMLAAGVTALPASDATLSTSAGSSDFDGTTSTQNVSMAAIQDTTATYNLLKTYDSSNWFNSFVVQALGTADPTGGFVNYVSQSVAQSSGLYKIQNGQVYMGVDSTSVTSTGRNSVRIESSAAYTHGLFILDLAHMPASICGSWPAYWMYGPNWPNSGEIDIIEGVNLQSTNQMTLHTTAGCTVTVGEGGQSGSSGSNNCNDNSGYNGCPVYSNTGNSYGTGFNSAGGGVYATFWNGGSIQMWYWPRSSVPSDITNGSPAPSGWGTPMAHFAGCAFDNYIKNNNIVFDTTFCGQWAGNVWSSSNCPSTTGYSSCNDYVANNPGAFANSYWLINSLKVYSVD